MTRYAFQYHTHKRWYDKQHSRENKSLILFRTWSDLTESYTFEECSKWCSLANLTSWYVHYRGKSWVRQNMRITSATMISRRREDFNISVSERESIVKESRNLNKSTDRWRCDESLPERCLSKLKLILVLKILHEQIIPCWCTITRIIRRFEDRTFLSAKGTSKFMIVLHNRRNFFTCWAYLFLQEMISVCFFRLNACSLLLLIYLAEN